MTCNFLGQPQDCIREVSSVKDKSVVDVAKYVLLIQAHKRCKNVGEYYYLFF